VETNRFLPKSRNSCRFILYIILLTCNNFVKIENFEKKHKYLRSKLNYLDFLHQPHVIITYYNIVTAVCNIFYHVLEIVYLIQFTNLQ